MIDEHHIDALTKLLGDKGVVTRREDMEAYEAGARYDRGRAAAVLRPVTTEEVSAAVGYCVRSGIALIPSRAIRASSRDRRRTSPAARSLSASTG